MQFPDKKTGTNFPSVFCHLGIVFYLSEPNSQKFFSNFSKISEAYLATYFVIKCLDRLYYVRPSNVAVYFKARHAIVCFKKLKQT